MSGLLYGMLQALTVLGRDAFTSYNKRGLEVHPHQLEGDRRAEELNVSRRGVRHVWWRGSVARVVRKLRGASHKTVPGFTRRGKRVLPYQEDHARRLFKKARAKAKANRRVAYKAACAEQRLTGVSV